MKDDNLKLAVLVLVLTLIQAGLVEFFDWEPWDAILAVCAVSFLVSLIGIAVVLVIADERREIWAEYTRDVRPLIEWMKRTWRRMRRR